MGQQQLILLVLATVIVGLAIVVGITAFSENSAKANADAMMQDAVRIANDIQAWGQKPEQFGGPDVDTETWTDATFPDMGYEESNTDEYTNLNGVFTLTRSDGASILIEGTRYEDDGTTVLNEVGVIVCGTTHEDDIVGSVVTVRGAAVGADPTCADATTTT